MSQNPAVSWLLQEGSGGLLMQMLPLFAIFAIFWFLAIRPQMRERKNQQLMRSQLKKGDKVITQGGVVAKVQSVKEREVILELHGNSRLTVLKDAIISVMNEQQNGDAQGRKDANRAKESSTSA